MGRSSVLNHSQCLLHYVRSHIWIDDHHLLSACYQGLHGHRGLATNTTAILDVLWHNLLLHR